MGSCDARLFFVVGLPRSGTAWLANFLNHGAVRCGHELTHLARSAEDLAGLMRQPALIDERVRFCGVCDTGLAAKFPELGARSSERGIFETAPVVVILRAPREVRASLERLGFPAEEVRGAVNWLQERLLAAAAQRASLIVPFAELTSERTCRRILEHVAPGEPFDAYRHGLLRNFNVQITPARVRELTRGAIEIGASRLEGNFAEGREATTLRS